MINRQTEETASFYVLDLLDEEARGEFESAMKESSELQRLVHELAEGIQAPVRRKSAISRPDLLPGILGRIGGTGPVVSGDSVKSPPRPASLPWAYIWGAAAAILLAMNLLLLFLVRDQGSIRSSELLELADDRSARSEGMVPGSSLDPADRETLEARIMTLEDRLAASVEEIDQYSKDLEQAEGQVAEVRDYNAEWQQEYARLAARILPFFEPNDGMGRFTVIEMVDNEVYSNDLPRRGFADLAGRFLSGEGNIAGVGTDEFYGPVVEGAGVLSATPDETQPGISPIARGSSLPIPEGAANTANSTGATGPQSTQPVVQDNRPTGFTVWRDEEQKGFLDLYNMPQVAEGQEAFLWVRASELEPYVPIGIVPTLDNGTGSLFYSVEEPNFTPTEILITAEDSAAVGAEPVGTVILRGP